jgi:hypothetical protein
LTLACWTVAFSILVVGCATPTPDLIEAPFTVVVTPTPVEETIALAQMPGVFPTAPAPPALTPEGSTTVPASVTPLPTVTPVPPSEPYDDRGDPVRLLASYYNAINRKEYRRAWEYWETPPNPSYEDFVQGYADTAHVFLAVSPPTFVEGAAGSRYTSVPALMIAARADGDQRFFVGCYVTRLFNPGADGAPSDQRWSLYSATVSLAPGNTTDATLLAQACESPQPEPPYEDRADPVRLLASYFNAVNLKEYRRAWEYWETPPNPSYEDFVQGYAETASVFLVVRLPVRVEGAAGSEYAGIPTLLIAIHTDGSRHAFVGCYVGRRVNAGTGGVGEGWLLYDAAIDATPGNSTDVILLVRACEALR